MAMFMLSLFPGAPKLALKMAGLPPFVSTQSIALITQLREPVPSSSKTFTAWIVVPGATP